jgi:hypothetical protein
MLVVAGGLASRHIPVSATSWIKLYLGDSLWALMVFIAIGIVLNKLSSRKTAILALAFSYLIEISQLYHAAWIDAIRHTSIGGLILGFGFLWSDLVCYFVGIAVGFLVETAIVGCRQKGLMTNEI